jgi:REP element-mobilizing transposase RayT
MSMPIAYLLTWTCYGTWLHGDERGSVDAEHRTPGEPFVPPSVSQRYRCARLMSGPTIQLSPAAREVVAAAIRAHCQFRGWELIALNVRSNHVHTVVSCGDVKPEPVMGQFKAYATRWLREKGFFAKNQKIWTEHGSTGYLRDQKSVSAAALYVEEAQDVPRE